MGTPTNHAIVGPDLHRARPGIFARSFCQVRGRPKKSYDLSAGPPAGTAPYYGQSGPG